MTKHTVTPLDLYCGLMEEIKARISYTENVLKGLVTPPFPGVIAREHCFLQLRMICEIVAIGCIVSHNQTAAVNAFEKLWNAQDIMDRLEKLNPYFFPSAVSIQRWPDGKGFDIAEIRPAPLTKDQFLKLYGRCGDGLHRGHLRKITKGLPAKQERLDDIALMVNSIIDLLRAHKISSADYKNHYFCVMENTPGGACAVITSVADPNMPPQPPDPPRLRG